MDETIQNRIDDLLRQRHFDTLLAFCAEDRKAWKALQGNLYSTNENLIWPAVEVSAMMMKQWWNDGEKEKVREYIRRLFWSLNDESGGIGWNAPQTIAQIIILIPELIDPYGSMMIDRTMEEPLLFQNGLWAIGRLGRQIEPSVSFFKEPVLSKFSNGDPQTLGMAAWAMGEVAFASALPMLKTLRERQEPVRIYINGSFYEKPLEQWASDAIAKINSVE